MNSDYWIDRDKQFHLNTYGRLPLVLTRGSGTKVWDVEGREYTDFLAGIGVLNIGHCPPAVVEAVCRQARELTHVSNLFYSPPQIELAAKLSGLGGGKCFFANSGAEANEGALKLARRWGKTRFSPEKTEYVTALNSFHGRTLATLTATGQPAKNQLFEPLPGGFKYVPFNDIEALERAVDDKTCAVMLEAVQGEGGVWPATAAYLAAARRLCAERGALLIFDEVQSGMGRTGRFFAFDHFDVAPDIITMAKGLASGLPIGAIIAAGQVADVFNPGEHGSTFGGGPVVTAAALATIKVVEDKQLVEGAARLGDYLTAGLKRLAGRTGQITDVRGLGLMVGVDLAEAPARDVVVAMLGEGFIINNTGERTLRFLPPLIITEGEIDAMLAALGKVLTDGGVNND